MAQESLEKLATLTIGRASAAEKQSMQRRNVLKGLAAVAVLPSFRPAIAAPFQRVRPGDPGWPAAPEWEDLKEAAVTGICAVGRNAGLIKNVCATSYL